MTYPLFIVLILANISLGIDLEEWYSWKYIDYVWKSPKQKQEAIKFGDYIPEKNILYDGDMAPAHNIFARLLADGRVFVTVVREKGVPASLMTVSNKIGSGGRLLSPYPDWSWYNNIDCNMVNNTIINVYRVSIKCNRLYVVDCGQIGNDTVCPPKLLIFDLENDKLIKTIPIPPNIATNKNGIGLLITPVAHVQDCEDINNVTVYIADIRGNAVIKYNENSGFCRIESTFMESTNPNFTIENQSCYLKDGPLGITITPYEDLYYTALAGLNVYKMDMRNLQECSKLNSSEVDRLTQLAGTLSDQTAPIASTQNIIFFSNIPEASILCASADKFDSSKTVVAKDSKKLQFPSGLKIINFEEKEIWQLFIVTNRLQRVMTNTLDLNETNFRILVIRMMQILEDTNCFASYNHNTPWYLQFLYYIIKTFTEK